MKPTLILALFAGLLALPIQAQEAAPESQLCRMQLDLLVEGDKLTAEEQEVFEAQCACLEEQEATGEDTGGTCAQEV
ncbi:MAG: hypothetical protein P0Y65_07510 [Candidatus Devosia phytovorans]|uniref:Secreted protein n=1 Tax=Candidatus Devosia phytovorans TaxID=3121372 RepID=A0AAJ5VZ53_9HYPH|nr:hypothetical protein [Devosia sp.]WEK06092.1 MAG: hypothetical protein P0Y65_07510 [Devosia sp.]